MAKTGVAVVVDDVVGETGLILSLSDRLKRRADGEMCVIRV